MASYGIKVYPLHLGDMYSDSNYIILGDTYATAANPHAPHRLWHSPSTAYLIDHPKVGYILYDTGMPDDPTHAWPKEMVDSMIIEKPEDTRMVNQLAKCGVKPEDIRFVISSHLHMDHIGNDHLFADTASFIVSRAEADRAYRSVLYSATPTWRGYYIKDEVLQTRKSIDYLETDMRGLFPGIDAYILPGHTPGILALYIHLEGQDLFLVEDAIACQRNYDGAPAGGSYDSLGYAASVRRVRFIAEHRNALVLFGHDPEQFKSMKLAPDYYA